MKDISSKSYADFYNRDWENAYGFWHKIIDRCAKQIDFLQKVIERLDKSEIKILDLGCGAGDEIASALKAFPKKRFYITAVDSSDQALNIYSENNSVTKSIKGDLHKIPDQLNEKFDLILFAHSLYCSNLEGLFKKYLRLLEPRGIILIFLGSQVRESRLVRERFWEEAHGVVLEENTTEDIVGMLNKSRIDYSLNHIKSHIDLKKLEILEKEAKERLFLNFLFRLKRFDSDFVKKVDNYINLLQKDGKLSEISSAIVIKK